MIDFSTAIELNDQDTLKKYPKTDVHNHAIFGYKLTLLEKLIQKKISPPPAFYDGLHDMFIYYSTNILPYISSTELFKKCIELTVEQAIEDGVIYLESSIDCRAMLYFDKKEGGLAEYIKYLVDTNKNKIIFKPELGISRKQEISEAEYMAEACLSTGVFNSIDLYNEENDDKPYLYKEIYKSAHRKGLKLKAHIGEFKEAKYIQEYISILKIQEIQHGITAMKCQTTMELIKNSAIQLNICPISNIKLRAIKSNYEYQLKKLLDLGISLSINTDDITLFGNDVNQEYLFLFENKILSSTELDSLRIQNLKNYNLI